MDALEAGCTGCPVAPPPARDYQRFMTEPRRWQLPESAQHMIRVVEDLAGFGLKSLRGQLELDMARSSLMKSPATVTQELQPPAEQRLS